jgi:hypothetical protein
MQSVKKYTYIGRQFEWGRGGTDVGAWGFGTSPTVFHTTSRYTYSEPGDSSPRFDIIFFTDEFYCLPSTSMSLLLQIFNTYIQYSMPIESRVLCSLLSSGIRYSRLQRVTIPDSVNNTIYPPEDRHVNARNMSRIVMEHTYCYRIKELCIKLVIETICAVCPIHLTLLVILWDA